jgi:hypothetical protein
MISNTKNRRYRIRSYVLSYESIMKVRRYLIPSYLHTRTYYVRKYFRRRSTLAQVTGEARIILRCSEAHPQATLYESTFESTTYFYSVEIITEGPRAGRTVSESYHRSRVSRTPRPRIAPVAGRSVVERKSRGCVGNRSSGSRSPPGSRRITARTSTARVSTSRARLSSSLAMLLRSTARAFS